MLKTTSTSKHVTTKSKKRQIYSILLLLIFSSIIVVEVSMLAVRNKILKKFHRFDKAKSLRDTNYVHNQNKSTAQITERLFKDRKQLSQETCNNEKSETFFRNVTIPTEILTPENNLSISKLFTNVGEPFERRISGYRNTLEENRQKNHKLKSDFKNEIRKQSNITSNLPESTIRELLFCLVNRHKNRTDFDEVWCPIYTKSAPRNINLNTITEAEIYRPAAHNTRLENMRDERPGNSINVSKIVKPCYFSQTDQNLLQDVLQTYELNFPFVGYNNTKYFEYFQMDGQLHSQSNETDWG